MNKLGEESFGILHSFLNNSIETFPDARRAKNTRYSIKDIGSSAFGVFFCQSPSFLAYRRLMQEAQGNNNGRTLFGIQKLPTENQIRNLLDPVDPELLDKRCALLRTTLSRRDTFFQHISALTKYLCFESWQQMMLFMITGLKLQDPCASPP